MRAAARAPDGAGWQNGPKEIATSPISFHLLVVLLAAVGCMGRDYWHDESLVHEKVVAVLRIRQG